MNKRNTAIFVGVPDGQTIPKVLTNAFSHEEWEVLKASSIEAAKHMAPDMIIVWAKDNAPDKAYQAWKDNRPPAIWYYYTETYRPAGSDVKITASRNKTVPGAFDSAVAVMALFT
jgi:hypothetical protein